MEVAGGLLVEALDCGLKRSRVPVPLVAEINFSSGVYSGLPHKLSRRFSFGGDIKPVVLGNPLKLAQVLLGISSLTGK